jgi:hypothetical protein
MAAISILSFSTPKYRIRAWRRTPYKAVGFTELHVVALRLQDLPLVEIAEQLLKEPGVVSIEVLDWDNNGVQCYHE